MTKPPKTKEAPSQHIPNVADRGAIDGRSFTSRGLLSHVPYSQPTASNVFGIGSEHPFANYWTFEGGLREVVEVLPDKTQADILLAQYFEIVDPVYPMIHRLTFYADYEAFWSMPPEARYQSDASFVGLMFTMLALGTQFVTTATSPQDRKQTAEFYASASNQALRIFSYLSTASMWSIQAMVLVTYFLINDNHASDGWAFAGILIRQAYAMGLHRDPNIGKSFLADTPIRTWCTLQMLTCSVTPGASQFEKQQRRKLWQAVLLQDTFLTVLLSLPPSATHTDVSVDDLSDDGSLISASDPTDIAYIRGSWTLANLVQETICSPRSLDLPICTTMRTKTKLVSEFRSVYRSFPDVFRSWDAESLTALARTNKRVVRQTLFLTSNYHHNLMLVQASESPDAPINVRGTLEAAHDAIDAFFVLFNIFEVEARVWWVFNHRAFLEALCIGSVIRETLKKPGGTDLVAKDAVFVRARTDISKCKPSISSRREQRADQFPRPHDADHAAHGRGRRGIRPCQDKSASTGRILVRDGCITRCRVCRHIHVLMSATRGNWTEYTAASISTVSIPTLSRPNQVVEMPEARRFAGLNAEDGRRMSHWLFARKSRRLC